MIKLVLFIGDKEISVLRKNKIVSLPFLRQVFNFISFIVKSQAHLPCVLEKKRVSCYIPLREKRKFQVTKLARRAKLSRFNVLLNLK